MMKKYWILLFVGIGLYMAACNKTGITDTAPIPYPTPDSSRDLRTVLAGSPFTLFQQAAKRARLDSLIPTGSYFTILAPVDSAMQLAGLTADVINGLPLDSLQKIVFYHVVQGSNSPASLTAAVNSIQASAVRQDVSFNSIAGNYLIYQQSLFLKKTGALYVNGEAANDPADTAFTASNGYIYPVRSVLIAPTLPIWGVLESRPELSMYLAALRLNDSLYYANGLLGIPYNSILGDSVFLNFVVYANQPPFTSSNPNTMTTVFAPSNAAFAAAGFHSPDDLRAYAESSSYLGVNYSISGDFNFTPLDSVLKQHLIGNSNYYFSNLSLYNDLLFNPDINNGTGGGYNASGFNTFLPSLQGPVYTGDYALQFSNKSNVVNIQWSGDPNQPPATLPADKGRHFMATNGVVCEIDRLFYPHN